MQFSSWNYQHIVPYTSVLEISFFLFSDHTQPPGFYKTKADWVQTLFPLILGILAKEKRESKGQPGWMDEAACRTCHQLDDPEDRPVGAVEWGGHVESQRPGQTDGDSGQSNWGMSLLMGPLPSHALAIKSSFFCKTQILPLWMIWGPCQTFDGFPLSLPCIRAGWLLKSGQCHMLNLKTGKKIMLNLPALYYQLEVPWQFFGLFLKHFWTLYTSGVKWDLLCPTLLRPRGSAYKLPLTPGLMRSLWAGVRANFHWVRPCDPALRGPPLWCNALLSLNS